MTGQSHEFETYVRVRYDEADPMGFVHHANYFRYFEYARTEWLRALGHSYREVEDQGLRIVVVRSDVNYRLPARYDDELRVRIRVLRLGAAKIEHEYTVLRQDDVLADARITMATINHHGRVRRMPDWMRGKKNH